MVRDGDKSYEKETQFTELNIMHSGELTNNVSFRIVDLKFLSLGDNRAL
jgi:hypothetical protein